MIFSPVSFIKLPAPPRPPSNAEYLLPCVLLKCKCVDFYPLYGLGRAGLTGIRHQLTAKSFTLATAGAGADERTPALA